MTASWSVRCRRIGGRYERIAEIKKWLADTAEEPLEEMGSFFAARVEGYEEHMSPWREYYRWMAALIPQGAETLLDIGCGTGLELDEIFCLHPEIAVTGIDLEPSMLERLRGKHGHRNLRLIEGDYFRHLSKADIMTWRCLSRPCIILSRRGNGTYSGNFMGA